MRSRPMRPRLDVRWLLERRSVLLGLGAVGATALLPGCPAPKPVDPPPTEPLFFDTLRSLRDLVRSSPDHLAARSASVIASKDFTAAVRFVRDSIGVVPPSRSTDSATDAVRWGPDATLRAGAGTVRERAELLKAMLLAMGATAKVVSAARPNEVDASALYRTRPPSFAVDLAALQTLGAKVAASLAHLNEPFPDTDPSATVTSLLGMLPAGQAVVATPFDGLASTVPVVEYTANGVTHWAFAMGGIDEVASAPASLGSELGSVSYPSVSVRLLGSMGTLAGVSTAPGLVELVAGSWTTDQLAGSRLLITLSSADPASAIGTPRDDVSVRVPLMTVKRPTPLTTGDHPQLWSPAAAPAPASAHGNPVTLSGARLTLPAQPDGALTGPYGDFKQLTPAAHATALASVASLQAVANAGAFADLQLTVSALDSGGAPVFGLTPRDFTIVDEGAAQQPTMLSNAGIDTLKVMLAYDCSGSITWPTPAARAAFEDQLANAMVTSAATTPFLLGVAPVGSAPSSYGAPDATAIKSVFASCNSFSDVWTTLGELATAAGCSAVVVVSDFQATDDPNAIPALQKKLASSGLAVAVVPVSTGVSQSTVDDLVRVAGAVVLDPSVAGFQTRLTDFVSTATRRAKVSGYRFGYRLPSDQQANQGTRTARVSLAATSSIGIDVPYQVPAAADRGHLGIAGLYLELRVGGSPTVTRWLSGPRLNRFGTPGQADATHYEATRDLISGLISVAFEPGSPTSSANVEDQISSALSMEALSNSVGKTLSEALTAGSGMEVYGSTLGLLVDPLRKPDADPVVTPEGLRVVVMTEAAGYHGFARHLDVVPDLNLAHAATTDGAAAFQATMRATLGVSLREAMVMRTSAAAALVGAHLQYLAPFGDPSTLTGFSATDLAQWSAVFDQYVNWHRLVPTTPAPGAMWLVDPRSGTTVAVFVDGTGGGKCSNAGWNALLQEALAILAACIAYKSIECNASTALNGYACLGAVVATTFAGVGSLFAAAFLKQDSYIDIWMLVIGAIVTPGPPQLGADLSILALIMSTMESIDSLSESC